MKDIAKGLLVAGAIIGASSATAFSFEEICPYVGAEYEWSHMKGAGANRVNAFQTAHSFGRFYPKSYSGANFFVGGRWCDFGAELGYTFTGKKSRTARFRQEDVTTQLLNAFDQFNGFDTGTFGALALNDSLRTSVKLNSWHVDFNGYLPICECWEAIGSIGYEWARAKMHITGTHAAANVIAGQPNVLGLNVHGRYKGFFRLGVGTQYMVTECIGLRAMVRWRNTEKLSVKINSLNPNVTNPALRQVTFKPFKDSVSLAVGAFFKF